MKHLFLSLATTTTLLLILTTTTTTTAIGDDEKIVYDAYGQPLIAGEEYYIIPYSYNPLGGGFTWKKAINRWQRCPSYYVVQYNDNLNFGEPITFKPSSSKQSDDETIITLSTNVNIAFNGSPKDTRPPPHCGKVTGEWKVKGNVVELGGQSGIIDPSSYVFTIENGKEDGYNIKFCPKGEHGSYACGGLGVITENGERRLVVNATNPLVVVFDPSSQYLIKKYTSYA